MRFSVTAAIGGLLAASLSTKTEAALELSPDTFDEQVYGSKNVFVKFLAPW